VGCDLVANDTNYTSIVANNYFEDSVSYQNAGSTGNSSTFGPGNNLCAGGDANAVYFVAAFGNYTTDDTVSIGNKYGCATSGILHDYSGAAKNLFSIGDTFVSSTPITKINLGNAYVWGSKNSSSQLMINGPVAGSAQWYSSQSFGTAPAASPAGPIDVTNSGNGVFAQFNGPSSVAIGFALYAGTNAYVGTTNNANVFLGTFTAGYTTHIYGANVDDLDCNATGCSFAGVVDASGATQLKLPVAAGYASAANGEIGYDTTNLNWHAWLNGADNFIAGFPVGSPPTSGHVAGFLKSTNSWSLQDLGAVGTAANNLLQLDSGASIPTGVTAHTQTTSDTSADVATDAFVHNALSALAYSPPVSVISTSGSPYTLSGSAGFYWNNTGSAFN